METLVRDFAELLEQTIWDLNTIRCYWIESHKHSQDVLNVNFPFNWDNLYLGNVLFETWTAKTKNF